MWISPVTMLSCLSTSITPMPGKGMKSTTLLSSCALPFHGLLLKDFLPETISNLFVCLFPPVLYILYTVYYIHPICLLVSN